MKLEGIGSNLSIEGMGQVVWKVVDAHGNTRLLMLPAYYVPSATSNLLSIILLLQVYSDETISINPTGLVLSGSFTQTDCHPVHVNIDSSTGLPTCQVESHVATPSP